MVEAVWASVESCVEDEWSGENPSNQRFFEAAEMVAPDCQRLAIVRAQSSVLHHPPLHLGLQTIFLEVQSFNQSIVFFTSRCAIEMTCSQFMEVSVIVGRGGSIF